MVGWIVSVVSCCDGDDVDFDGGCFLMSRDDVNLDDDKEMEKE